MGRELKFRAWDKLNKSFIYPDKGYQGHYVLTLDGKFQNLQNGSGGDEYVVQQYSNTKDNFGKEIYEGDLIQVIIYNNEIFEVIVEDDGSFGLYSKKYPVTKSIGSFANSFKVVGNIFENEKGTKI
jgi:hypothetical protein